MNGKKLKGMKFLFVIPFLSLIAGTNEPGDISQDHVFLNRGSFTMGANRKDLADTGEFPTKYIQVKPFAIDKYPVTNGDFKVFKREKPHYVTEAEVEGYSWVLDKHKSTNAEIRSDLTHPDGKFWAAVKDASWRQPFGKGSNIEGKDKYPVVHVSYHDAYAFCGWAGKRVVSEYEWEYAARGGESNNRFPWGNTSDFTRTNLWQGRFPELDLAKDGFDGISPVDAFDAQNEFDVYDMLGNVWEWTSTIFTIKKFEYDQNNPTFTIRGASFIDSFDGRVNNEARISHRKGLPPTYRAENLGFRCAYFWKPGQLVTKLYRPRPPVYHRYEDTWEYKKTVRDTLGKAHETDEL